MAFLCTSAESGIKDNLINSVAYFMQNKEKRDKR